MGLPAGEMGNLGIGHPVPECGQRIGLPEHPHLETVRDQVTSPYQETASEDTALRPSGSFAIVTGTCMIGRYDQTFISLLGM